VVTLRAAETSRARTGAVAKLVAGGESSLTRLATSSAAAGESGRASRGTPSTTRPAPVSPNAARNAAAGANATAPAGASTAAGANPTPLAGSAKQHPPASAPEESATIKDDPTTAPDPSQSADNNVSFPTDI